MRTPPPPHHHQRSVPRSAEHDSSMSSTYSSPDTLPPCTPPHQSSNRHSLYSYGSFSCDSVVFSTPKRGHATPLAQSTPSPVLLPIGNRHPARKTERPNKTPPSRLGLGLNLEELAVAPSLQPEITLQERAQRRRGIDFHAHAQFSRVFRLSSAVPEDMAVAPDRSDGNRDSGLGTSFEGDLEDGDDFSWEAEDEPSPELGVDDLLACTESCLEQLAAAFPSPPASPPEFPLSLSSGLRLGAPPDLPLPPTPPPFHSPHVYGCLAYRDGSQSDHRLTVIDPDESMARLEESMAKLQAYNVSGGGFLEEDEDAELDSDTTACVESSYEEPGAPLDAIGEDPQEEDEHVRGNEVKAVAPAKVGREEHVSVPTERPEDRIDRLVHSLSSSTFARVGFSPHASRSSTSVATTAGTESTANAEHDQRPSIELLPEFDFEKTRRAQAKEPRPRSSSLGHAGRHAPDPSASPGLKRAAADAPRPPAADKDRSTEEQKHRGASSRPTSPLRRARSTPFLLRPVRPPAPAGPIPPLPLPLPAPKLPRGAPAHAHAQAGSKGLPPPPRTPAPPPPRAQAQTLAGREGDGLLSFMHMVPEPPGSRVSKLFNRACAGLGAGLRREKSLRWLRGSFVQARD
ncbi:hypothetical protein AcV7_004483 [Taiwanofungus camphoratus]|nr:hypothetical protein AcV7_004483 [Antrodia cinnamomea]